MRASIALVAALFGALGAAQAAERPPRQPQPAQTYVVPVQFCEKMCPEDFAPCDPPYFKTADARCAQVGAGR
ncbi:hypothetical protein FM996_18665 [Methylosinus sporium]|uniref:Kazal-like domain-containing protein n=1 Tax=Methylosinus sporium TaxID=428 RepID=A0A549SEZ1_METSR|nr:MULTISPECIES: hypothetical protein [Methylosinus]MBU3888690.1 hypothetical protein [Methylosinus sp. KRF6]TRL27778.1 hypothetical protein FM996_18665 [Methylosinus sporium]